MGKKKRRGKQKGPQQEGAEPDDSNTEPNTETLPNADTPNINNSPSSGNTSIPPAIDNKDSLIPLSKEGQKSSLKEQGKEVPIPEAEIIVPNISEGKSAERTPENVPEIPIEHNPQVTEQTSSSVIGLKVDNTPDNAVIAEVGNNFSAEKSPLANVADSAGASEVTHQQQIPKEILNSKRPECEPSVSLMQISEGQSSEKNIMNIGDHGTLLNSSPESIIPSNDTHQVKSPIIPHEEEIETTDKKTKEKTVDKTIPGETSEEISAPKELSKEKCSQNTNIPVKLAPEESIIKIHEKPDEKKIPGEKSEEISVHKEEFPTEKCSQKTNIPVKLIAKESNAKIEEKPDEKKIPGEISEEISVRKEKFPTEKCSQNTNIPVKLASEESIAKIQEKPDEKKIPGEKSEKISAPRELSKEKCSQNTNIPVKLAAKESNAKIEEKPDEKKIPGEKSEEISARKEEFPTEKCSQNKNIPAKLASEESIAKIQEKPDEKKIPGEKSEEISARKEEFPTEKCSQNKNIPAKLASEESIAKIQEKPDEKKIPGEKSEEISARKEEFPTEKCSQNKNIPAKLASEESIAKIQEKPDEKKIPGEKSEEISVCKELRTEKCSQKKNIPVKLAPEESIAKIDKKPSENKTPGEKSEGISARKELPTEKCSQNTNIPVKLAPEESIAKIERENNDQIDFRQITESSVSEQTTTQETKVVDDSQNLNSSCQNNPQKETKGSLQSQKSLPPEKDESVQNNTEQQALSDGNSNEQIVSSITGTKKSNKKNKKSNANKSKAKIKEDKPSLSSDCCELSKTEDTDQKEELENLELGAEPKIIKKSDFKYMEENSTTGEKIETPSCKIQPIEENLKSTGGNIGTVKDQEINVIPTSKSKPSSQVITKEKDIENINNISSSKGTENNQPKGENNTNVFANNTDDMKNCSQVCSSSSEERPVSQTISSSQRKDSEHVAQIQCKEEPEKKTGIQSSELGTHKTETEDSINPSLKGNNEAGKKQPHFKSNDKGKNIAAKNPSHQQKIITGAGELNTQNQTVLDSFVDTNMNTMLSRNKKGASKQKKSDNKRNPTSNKKAESNTSDENKHEEVKHSEEVIKEESKSGSLQQTTKTISTKTKHSTTNTELSHTNENNTNQGNAQESQANLEKEGEGHSLLHTEGRVPARPIFMANTCHICKLTHGGSTRLQTCSACRLITYCSKEHQKKHWKEHKSICKVVQNMVRQRGLTDLFSNAHKITDADEWRKFRCILLTEAENHVDRALFPYEREMFLYPRTCGKCHRSDPEKLKVCKLCHYMNYCCNEHIASDHHIWCQDLKLLLEINQYQSLYGLIKPFIPTFNFNESKPFPKDMKDFILNYVSKEKNFDLFNLYETTLSDVASYPLTVLYAINYLKERNFYAKLSDKLTIHLVGAESQFEADTISKWDAFLINLLPDVVKLDLVFIGPELTPNNTNKMNCGNSEIKNVKTKDPSKQLVTEFHYGKLYHEYAKEENFSKPDIICAFNCGIYRFTGFNKQDTWGPTMSSMLKYPHTPIILTAYTAVEAPKDVERFQNQFKIEIVHKTARNPFSSMRPNLNFVSDDETPVIYKNQYLSIIVKGD